MFLQFWYIHPDHDLRRSWSYMNVQFVAQFIPEVKKVITWLWRSRSKSNARFLIIIVFKLQYLLDTPYIFWCWHNNFDSLLTALLSQVIISLRLFVNQKFLTIKIVSLEELYWIFLVSSNKFFTAYFGLKLVFMFGLS